MTKFSEQQQGDSLLQWASTKSRIALMSSSKVKGPKLGIQQGHD